MKKFLTNSLLARTTVLVLGISFLVGSLFSGLAYIYFLQAEQERAVSYTAGLLDTVEDTMQIACYLSDRNLAKDVVDGIGKRNEVKVYASVTVKLYWQNSTGKTMLLLLRCLTGWCRVRARSTKQSIPL
jgi:hypothetical protein